jgi:hypothetical protein
MTAASEARNMSAISATASTFSGFAMALLPEVSRHRLKESWNGKRPRHAGVEASRTTGLTAGISPRRARPCGSLLSPAQAVPWGLLRSLSGWRATTGGLR